MNIAMALDQLQQQLGDSSYLPTPTSKPGATKNPFANSGSAPYEYVPYSDFASVPMGYESAINVTPASAYQNPYQLGALGNMMNAYSNMYGADAQARGQIGAAEQAKLGNLGVSQNQLTGQLDQNLKNLLGIQDTNKTQLGISGNQLTGQKYVADQNLLGIKDSNVANQNIAGIQGNAQMGTAAIGVGPKYEQLDILKNLLGGATVGSGLGGLGGGGGSGLGTAVDLNGGSGTGGATGAPPVPAFKNFDEIALQRKMGGQAADISQQYDTQNKQMANSLAGRGFSTNSPGFQALIANNNAQKLGAITNSNRDLQSTAMQYNAQNALPYAQAGLGQYNAEADRATRLKLAQMANSQGLLTGLLSV